MKIPTTEKEFKKTLRVIARQKNATDKFEALLDLITEDWNPTSAAALKAKWLPRFEFYLHHKSRGPEHLRKVSYKPDGTQVLQWCRVIKVRTYKVLIPVGCAMARRLAIVD